MEEESKYNGGPTPVWTKADLHHATGMNWYQAPERTGLLGLYYAVYVNVGTTVYIDPTKIYPTVFNLKLPEQETDKDRATCEVMQETLHAYAKKEGAAYLWREAQSRLQPYIMQIGDL